jgi:hypothetical protein
MFLIFALRTIFHPQDVGTFMIRMLLNFQTHRSKSTLVMAMKLKSEKICTATMLLSNIQIQYVNKLAYLLPRSIILVYKVQH